MSSWLSQGSERPDIDPERYEELLRDLYNQMIRVAFSRVKNKSDAYDVVQDAWVRILMKHDSLREENKLEAWAKKITANVAHNVNRKYSTNQTTSEWCDLQADCLTVPSEAELMMEISELLGALDPRSRTMILYKFYYGFKDQEIADVMNMPVGTVKARIHRSRERLKQSNASLNI
ncbi:RNA polymerase sigma factor [Paenibacillaceae bacterium]|nr:RNA polymerase sigma factor [Paenibacillaceae bacterium]